MVIHMDTKNENSEKEKIGSFQMNLIRNLCNITQDFKKIS